jgi:hypothetical protein
MAMNSPTRNEERTSMKLMNLERALKARYGSLERMDQILTEYTNDDFCIDDPPWRPFYIQVLTHPDTFILWGFSITEVNEDVLKDPLVKYRMTIKKGTADFEPFYLVATPAWPPCDVTEGSTDIAKGLISCKEIEQYAQEWDMEFGKRGWPNKVRKWE